MRGRNKEKKIRQFKANYFLKSRFRNEFNSILIQEKQRRKAFLKSATNFCERVFKVFVEKVYGQILIQFFMIL
ncbi:hypothetical protein LIMHP_04470 [Leptospira interrogans serovar Manilae]|uniref:Uncharacterized protein n=1 Tax=Leptospira interrogans serovar Zanoni str. LT2156 TaxID=1001601 RepID=M6HKT4_LEPIR|nr:hypothetical protein LIMLP_04485 [Leptospira interrogans serovar Manilae]AKP29061.1 hypothetical protein LIMHP_04470 [Leptospira interrogans serovar Manilae]EMM97745.1 hypothetical protein LEP1GSC158_3576 [Leptospira interrogans serovar Zanoni str. LT2156]EYU64875.1 hypothetical protein CI00_02845 [Leptospira interrogans serovar Manilae]